MHALEVVCHGSETQLQVIENSNYFGPHGLYKKYFNVVRVNPPTA